MTERVLWGLNWTTTPETQLKSYKGHIFPIAKSPHPCTPMSSNSTQLAIFFLPLCDGDHVILIFIFIFFHLHTIFLISLLVGFCDCTNSIKGNLILDFFLVDYKSPIIKQKNFVTRNIVTTKNGTTSQHSEVSQAHFNSRVNWDTAKPLKGCSSNGWKSITSLSGNVWATWHLILHQEQQPHILLLCICQNYAGSDCIMLMMPCSCVTSFKLLLWSALRRRRN